MVTSIIMLFGGLAFFLYGMHVMSTGLEKMSGSKLEKVLKQSTSNPFKSLLLGAGITIAIQSSSAMTVMLVGLVNSGIMALGQTIGVIMGSNIGTTLTAWILSLNGIESSENLFLNLLKPENFSPVIALVGIGMIMLAKRQKLKDIGNIFVGFAVLMYGMVLMGDAVEPLSEMEGFSDMLTAFTNPILGVLVGAVFTGVIQSSAASVGILMTLSLNGQVTFGMAIPIIMGQNIGTCVTALISSIGVNKNAKRVAVVHIAFNLIGSIVGLVLIYGLNLIFHFTFLDNVISPVGIAACHSIFNICTTALLLPFSKQLEKLANLVVRDSKTKEKYTFIDQRLLDTPSFAISECNNRTVDMAQIAKETILNAIHLFDNYDESTCEAILKQEESLDRYEDKLGTFLVRLSSKELSDSDSHQVSKMLHTIGDFERIGDHAVNLLKVAQEIHDKKIQFSHEAKRELSVLTAALKEILDITTRAFSDDDLQLATKVEPLEQVIDELIAKIKFNHIERLQRGNCTIELGFILSDVLTNYERVSDHCSNIAVAMIEVEHDSFKTHKYLGQLKSDENLEFSLEFNDYKEKYAL